MNLQPLSRKIAVANGWPFYVTGKRCKHGHVSSRIVRNRECRECARLRAARRVKPKENCERLAQWKRDNPERDRENSRISMACLREVRKHHGENAHAI